MDKYETEKIINFLYRIPMYVGIEDRDQIVSFMHGVDFSKSWEPYWTSLLRDFIVDKYDISGGPQGWPNQVELFAKSSNKTWVEAFKQLMLELIKESNVITFTVELQELNRKLSQRTVSSN